RVDHAFRSLRSRHSCCGVRRSYLEKSPGSRGRNRRRSACRDGCDETSRTRGDRGLMFLLLQMGAAQPDGTSASLLFFGCLLFAGLLMVYIFSPAQVETSEEKTRLGYLYERKDQVYENLRDLNFEYKAGKLGDSDFNSMRDAMEQEAANVLAEIERLEGQQPALRNI